MMPPLAKKDGAPYPWRFEPEEEKLHCDGAHLKKDRPVPGKK
jgi:hypothetical protein